MSPRNAAPAVTNLLERTGAHTIITQRAFFGLARVVRDALEAKGHKVEIRDVPELHDIFPSLQGRVCDVEAYISPAPRSWDTIVYYLHSSGSTGLPKPIPVTAIALLDECHCGQTSVTTFPAATNVPCLQTQCRSRATRAFH